MKTEQPILISSIEAAADLSKGLFIGFDGNLCSADAKALGVCNADTDEGSQAPVATDGIVLVLTGAAVDAGDPVVSDAASKAVPADDLSVTIPVGATPVESDAAQPVPVSAGSVLPQAINGYALDSSVGADEWIRIKLV